MLEQHKDVFDHYGLPPHQTIAQLLQMERMLRTNPDAITEVAKAYGRELPGAKMGKFYGKMREQLAAFHTRETSRTVRSFWKRLRKNSRPRRLGGASRSG